MPVPYRDVLFRLRGQDYAAHALMFIPGVGETISIANGLEFTKFRVVAISQETPRTIVDIEEVSQDA